MALETELAYFNEIRADLVAEHLGQFALVKGRELVDIYPSYQAALDEALALFGTQPFLIKEIREDEPVEMI